MKTLLLFLTFSFTITIINAQCSKSIGEFGNNVKDPPSYNISGDVSISLIAKNEVLLELAENFSTEPGPDVRVFLVDSDGKTKAELTETLIADLNHIDFGLIQSTGKQSFSIVIKDDKNISDFDTVFFYCLQYDHFWDLGKFESFTSNTCSVLDLDAFIIDAISVYPNPAKNQIQISNIDAVSAEIRIFNVLGKQVFHQSKIKNNPIDVSLFDKGIFLVKINVDGKSKTQKLVIQ
ncbi:DM13 domain-containing protein [Polaribacter sp. R77954]|uniref:T9SS type A sorting domain-containing protein n=1 Tax=Polaribacter sp. R77954 TaxID=3093870 RepID=UPI0037C80435